MKNIFYKFGENFIKIFAGKNLYWHFLAIFLTYIAVVSGLDWNYYLMFGHSSIRNFLFSGVIIGGLLPILLPIILYFFGKLKHNLQIKNSAYAIAQAGLSGWLVFVLYKTHQEMVVKSASI